MVDYFRWTEMAEYMWALVSENLNLFYPGPVLLWSDNV